LLDMPVESFERVMKINLQGPFFLTQNLARRMANAAESETENNRKFRAIVNIGSVSADTASINRGEYCMSKSAVTMATRLFAVRLADLEIAVYELRPGIIKSDMTECVTAKYDKLIAGGLTLQRRWGQPQDIGKAVVMLASGALAYSTGQLIGIDGGMTISHF
ncbi:MAG: SDR family oxidoreductase, partial [Lentisphaeria bacterium]|nr:SDR family oxidoreductase [Lentisphaeria bacterium]